MLLALGSNGAGQLGIGNTEDVSIPSKCQISRHMISSAPFSRINTIAAGGNHTLVLYHDGTLFASGNNSDGRCNLNYAAIKLDESPQLQSFISPNGFEQDEYPGSYQFCTATWEASICLDINGHIVTCGTGNRGELGLGEGVSKARRPRAISGFPPPGTRMGWLAASVSHVVAVLTNGDVYGWGSGRKGQLGQPFESVWLPRKIEGIGFHARRAVCGRDFTYIVGDPTSGEHMVIGSDKWDVVARAPETLPPWKEVGASWGSIFVLLQTGEILSWGRNDHGQLGPKNLPSVEQIAIGSEHAVALTSAGEVVAWGWGEHGNCGLPTEDGDVKDRWNVLAVSGTVYKLGAGCATSFIASLEDAEQQRLSQMTHASGFQT